MIYGESCLKEITDLSMDWRSIFVASSSRERSSRFFSCAGHALSWCTVCSQIILTEVREVDGGACER